MLSLSLASRYLAGRKLRAVLTTLAIVFGVLVIFGMNTLLPAFQRAFQINVLAAAGQVDATITLKTADAFPAEAASQVAAVEGVRVVSGLLHRTVNLPPDYYDRDPAAPDRVSALTLVGLDPLQATAMHVYQPRAGRFLQTTDADAAVIAQSLADMLGLALGQVLTLPTAQGEIGLTIVGVLPDRLLPGNEEVLVTLPQAQSMLAMPGKINTLEANFETIDASARAAVEQRILAALGDNYVLGGLAANAELLTNLTVAQAIFSVLGVLALLMGGFIIFNTFRTVVAERRRDIGMLRALGANRRTIFSVIIAEGLVQGIVGTALGMVLGYLLGRLGIALLNPTFHQFLNLEVGAPVVTPGLVGVSIGLGIGVTLLAGLLPAISATQVTPLEALRPTVGALTLRRMVGLGFWSGVVMIGLAVAALVTRNVGLIGLGGVLFVLGLILCAPALVSPLANALGRLLALVFARNGTAQLAQGNLARQPTRAAITASTTLIAMAILVMAAAFIGSATIGFERVLRKSLGSDFLLVPPAVAVWGTDVGAAPSLAGELRTVPGVGVVTSVRFAPTRINETAVSLLAVDPATYPQVSGLSFTTGEADSAYAALGQGRNMIINGLLGATAGVGVGDDVAVLTPAGPQAYRVVAIAGDYLNAKLATGYISQANLAADFNRTEDVLIQLNLAPGADAAATEAALRSAIQAYPQFRLIAGEAFITESLAVFDAAFAAMIALVVFLSVPSLIAMLNTLAIGVIERTREIGLLRAVGASRPQVRAVIVSEALILAAIGTVFGVAAGLYLGYMGVEAMQSAGYPMEFAFPFAGVGLALAAGVVFGALAALVPARQAAELEIVQALHYE